MTESLFDVLTGRVAGGRALEAVPEDQRLLWSVVSNLSRLFNTRRGTLPHLPDYGVPDMLTVYRDAPRSVEELRRTLKASIDTYEPRLRRVRIEQKEQKAYTMRLVFLVRAHLRNGQQVQFETTFRSQDATTVEPVGAYA
jgi:type VI secretion system protein